LAEVALCSLGVR